MEGGSSLFFSLPGQCHTSTYISKSVLHLHALSQPGLLPHVPSLACTASQSSLTHINLPCGLSDLCSTTYPPCVPLPTYAARPYVLPDLHIPMYPSRSILPTLTYSSSWQKQHACLLALDLQLSAGFPSELFPANFPEAK